MVQAWGSLYVNHNPVIVAPSCFHCIEYHASSKRRVGISAIPWEVSCRVNALSPKLLPELCSRGHVAGSTRSRAAIRSGHGAETLEEVLPCWEDVESLDGGLDTSSKSGRAPKKSAVSKTKQKATLRAQSQRPPEEAALDLFHATFREQYGERWDTLFPALKEETRHCCLLNKYARADDTQLHLEQIDRPAAIDFLDLPCYSSPSRFPQPQKDWDGTATYYLLDAASVAAAEALEVAPGERVLDLCAAPGGKSLALVQRLGLEGSLVANELSQARRRRLQQVLRDYVPSPLRERVRVSGHDGASWRDEGAFDKVLVDAPCSSERHVLASTAELARWTPRRARNCARRQVSLLNSALLSVRPGGTVVYSTCSISDAENDDVIAKILAKGKAPAEVVRRQWKAGEETKFGRIFLPDKSCGWGPLYIAVLTRLQGGAREDHFEQGPG